MGTPDKPGPFFLSAARCKQIEQLLAKNGIIQLDPTQFEAYTQRGETFYRFRGIIPRGDDASGGTTASGGPFCTTYPKEGNTWLRGGVVSGGDHNETMADRDCGTIGDQTDGDHIWIKAEFTATVEDGYPLPGGNLTAATYGTGSSLPENQMPTADTPAGWVIIDLGDWLDGVFRPAACGNIQVLHCPGTLSPQRV